MNRFGDLWRCLTAKRIRRPRIISARIPRAIKRGRGMSPENMAGEEEADVAAAVVPAPAVDVPGPAAAVPTAVVPADGVTVRVSTPDDGEAAGWEAGCDAGGAAGVEGAAPV